MNIKNDCGLSIHFLESGCVSHIEAGQIRISLKKAGYYGLSGANVYLRKKTETWSYHPLTGPGSGSRFQIIDQTFKAQGSWEELSYSIAIQLSPDNLSWRWYAEIVNNADRPVDLDLILVQDVGLKEAGSGLVNEYYVSQYLERLVLDDPTHGAVICCRQNMKEADGNPWLMIASSDYAIAGSTDGMQWFGKSCRATGIPEGLLVNRLGGNYAGESSVVALQLTPFLLEPLEKRCTSFVLTFLPDHPAASSRQDLADLPTLMRTFSGIPVVANDQGSELAENQACESIQLLPSDHLSESEIDHFFGQEKRHSEWENGQLLSFFQGHSNHVVLQAKEILADRPHGHIMQANAGFTPHEGIVSTTAYAFGVFNSHLSQGNTNFNVLLSVCTSQFNTTPECGQRIYVILDGKRYLLGVPSAFEMGLNHCRWIYRYGNHTFQVRSWTSQDRPLINLDFKVLSGPGVEVVITHGFDSLNQWTVKPGSERFEYVARPAKGSMIAGKYEDPRFRIHIYHEHKALYDCPDPVSKSGQEVEGESLFSFTLGKTDHFYLSILAEVDQPGFFPEQILAEDQWKLDVEKAQSRWELLSLDLCLEGRQEEIGAITEELPWFAHNAMIHFLTPYGLEQFSGAAWGTRDVSQGPVDLLLVFGRYQEARQVLCRIFSNQNADGGWSQWWMFDRYAHIRAADSHGDVVYWVILALVEYIRVTGDLGILQERVPFFTEPGAENFGEFTVYEHVERLIQLIVSSFIPGTSLVPFGGGDWNDSLQPVSKDLAQRMISSWTVEMNFQAFRQYQSIYSLVGDEHNAQYMSVLCSKIRADFNNYLVKDGIVAGYGLVTANGEIDVLLHPADTLTGIRYSLLPMERGILSGIFTQEQAELHQKLIGDHLIGPDGARLTDRPLKYKGGIQEIFQRAESSTFFGREIGLMYFHEHIRYAESLAIMGHAESFLIALRKVIPVNYRGIVDCGDIRQSNCYFSSSDVVFGSRYEADELYDQVLLGNCTLRGGWRVYSSGPGIFIGLVIKRLLGIRLDSGSVIIDPVMSKKLNDLTASLIFLGKSVRFKYRITGKGYTPVSIQVNGKSIQYQMQENPYRTGGAMVPANTLTTLLDQSENEIRIDL